MAQNIYGPGSSLVGGHYVQSTGLPSTTGDVPVYSDTSGLFLVDSGVKLSDKLSVSGSIPMTGALDMGNHDIKNTDDVVPAVTAVSDLGTSSKRYRSVYTDNLVGPTVTTGLISPSVTNTDDIGTSSKRYKTVYYTTLDPAPVDAGALQKSGGTMSGVLDMGAQEIINCSAIRSNNTNVIHGTSVALTGTNNTVMGTSANGSGSSTVYGAFASSVTGLTNTCIGANSIASATGNTLVGNNSSASGSQNVAVGASASATASSVAIGNNAISSATSAHVIGFSLTNPTTNSMLLQASNNIRPSATTCDLGTAGVPFQTLYLNTNLAGPTASRTADSIVSGPASAGADNVVTFNSTTGRIIKDSGATVVGSALAGYSSTTGTLSNADTVVGGISKLNGNLGTATNNIFFGQGGQEYFFLGASATTLYNDGSGLTFSWDSTNKQITFVMAATTWVGACTSIGLMGRYQQGTTLTNSSAIMTTFAAATTYYLSANAGTGARVAGMDMTSGNANSYQARLYPIANSLTPPSYYIVVDMVGDGSCAHSIVNFSRKAIS